MILPISPTAFIYAGNDLRSHTLGACSTIGPAGLNFRVRDGNGWNPRGMITDKSRRLADVNEPPSRRRLRACCRDPERLSAKDLYAISLSLFSDELSKILRLNTSQLNRLGVAYFLSCLFPISTTLHRLSFFFILKIPFFRIGISLKFEKRRREAQKLDFQLQLRF